MEKIEQSAFQEARERAYIAGQRSVWLRMLQEAMMSLGYAKDSAEGLANDLESARVELRELCRQTGLDGKRLEFRENLGTLIDQVTRLLVEDRNQQELMDLDRWRRLRDKLWELKGTTSSVETVVTVLLHLLDDLVEVPLPPSPISSALEAGQRLHDAAEAYRMAVKKARPETSGPSLASEYGALLVLEAAIRNWENVKK